MTPRRIIFAVVVLVLAVVLGGAALYVELNRNQLTGSVEPVEIGGPFTMTADDGSTVTEADLVGHPSLLFFGFTHCPDVCPATLSEVAAWLDELGERGESLEAFFVTVDPERDTVDRMAEYTDYFSPRITGLVGTGEQLARMAESYKVYYAKIDEDDGDYFMDHTAAVYLMDDQGRFFDAVTFQASQEDALAKIDRLLAASGEG